MKLSQKLLEIQKACNYFRKDTQGYNFSYTAGNTILATIRAKMDELGVLCYPEVREAKTTLIDPVKENKPKQIFTEIFMDFVWRCTETDAQLKVPWYGQGLKETEQGMGNALTYAERYFLLKFFKIPTDSDDPDHWEKKHAKKEPVKVKTKEELKKEVFEKQKKAIWDYIAKNPDFQGFLHDESMPPEEDCNIELIYNQSGSLKKKFLSGQN